MTTHFERQKRFYEKQGAKFWASGEKYTPPLFRLAQFNSRKVQLFVSKMDNWNTHRQMGEDFRNSKGLFI